MAFTKWLFIPLLVAIFSRQSLGLQRRAPIILYNNGFIGPLIAIHEGVPESKNLLDELMAIFTRASGYLYEASRQYTYLQNVTILIPRTWEDRPEYEDATWETYDIANVLIDEPNPQWWHNPYTKQTLPCGEPAQYIHLTPEFITERDFSEYLWGESGKAVIHEWGHLRWGLFDEYPISTDENFYFDENGHTQPTRCSAAVTGQCADINKNYRRCNLNPESGQIPEPGCTFFPDLNNNPGTSSYPFANYLDSVTDFCHDDDDRHPNARHNKLANNQQNKLCGHRSSWEVMDEHPDFQLPNEPGDDNLDTTPTFRLVIERPKRIVLVMDISGSMTLRDRLNLLVQATTKYIRYLVPMGTWLGLVEFSDNANITYPLTQITSNSVREDIIAALPKVTDDRTCIGCGILAGIQVLDDSDQPTEGSILFIVSDGQENLPPRVEDVIDDVIAAKVSINTMSFSNEADGLLIDLSMQTGGQGYYYSESVDSTALHDGFTSSIVDSLISSRDVPVTVESTTTRVNANNQRTGRIDIDFSLGNDTRFYFYFREFKTPVGAISVSVESPSGDSYDESTSHYDFDDHALIKTIEIPGVAETGRWRYTISNTDDSAWYIEVSVESVASSVLYGAMKLSTSLSNPVIEESPPKIAIYAELRYGHSPVTDANVVATIELPNDDQITLPLLDNGAGADILRDDGVYSSYFVDFIDTDTCPYPCRYSVSVKADDEYGTASIRTYSRGSGALAKNSSAIPVQDPEPQSIGRFSRASSAGLIQVAADVVIDPDRPDQLPPSRITDLTDISTMNSAYQDHVSLQWTATGDDFDQGTASKYELRYSNVFMDLFENFEAAAAVLESDVVEGTLLSPQPAGSTEKLTARVPTPSTPNMTYYFAIVAFDEADNRADPSNIVSVSAAIVQEGEVYNPGSTIGSSPSSPSAALSLWSSALGRSFMWLRVKIKRINKLNPTTTVQVYNTQSMEETQAILLHLTYSLTVLVVLIYCDLKILIRAQNIMVHWFIYMSFVSPSGDM
ncbi:calcium-activated chloride channel regulator 1-like [Ptychodera flava]|uniref:calcium-activated chloride channel regulator 1-like n=1 Tax=Ptychodera flava TaxID=63121 RepID=UPI00396A9A6D